MLRIPSNAFTTFFKLVRKAFRYATIRPLQRFNVENRSKKYLGPEAKYFKPAPRAIGAMSRLSGKPPQYPHLSEGGFISLRQKRLQAMQNDTLLPSQTDSDLVVPIRKSFSKFESDDSLIRGNANRLNVLKSVIRITAPGKLDIPPSQPSSLSNNELSDETHLTKPSRPLPKLTSLQMDDPTFIWQVDHVPPGRLSLSSFQEMMLNKMADKDYWTPDRLSERYNIKLQYASLLTQYVNPMKVIIPPRIKFALDYVCHKDPVYQATKDIIYEVDTSLRSELDKKYDSMFLPEDELDEKVRQVIGPIKRPQIEKSEHVKVKSVEQSQETARQPEPLRIQPLNTVRKTKRLKGVHNTPENQNEIRRLKSSDKV